MGNLLDAVIGYFSPEAGVRREAWRLGLEELRSYDAGNGRRLNENWRVRNESAEATDRYSRDIIRARARDLERNSDIANSITSAFKRNIVGAGYNLQARTLDEELNKKIEKYWKIWCRKRNCDVTGTQSLNQILRMIVERKKIDGGILIHKVYTSDGILPFKLQCLEVDELDTSRISPKKKGNRVVGGIEYNRYNKAAGYWIHQYDPDGFLLPESIYIEEKDILYLFSKKRPSQLREISDFTQTISRIRDANEFMTAVSVKERIAACLAVFIKRQTPDLEGPGRRVSGGVSENKYDYNGKTITPGMIKNLNPGDDVEVVSPSGQAENANQHIKLMQRLIGAGQGVSYEATSRDMSETNYSSARQGSIEDEMTYISDKEMIVEALDEIYETFLISGYLAGLFQMPNFWSKKEDYMFHEWIQSPKKWIDPAKESNANKIALQTGQKTFKQIASENGKDWQEQIDDMAEVLNYGKKKGIELGGVIFGQQSRRKETEGKTTDT